MGDTIVKYIIFLIIVSIIVTVYFSIKNNFLKRKRKFIGNDMDTLEPEQVLEDYSSYFSTFKVVNSNKDNEDFYNRLLNTDRIGKFKLIQIRRINQDSILVLSTISYEDSVQFGIGNIGVESTIEQNIVLLLKYNSIKKEYDVYSDEVITDSMMSSYYKEILYEMNKMIEE